MITPPLVLAQAGPGLEALFFVGPFWFTVVFITTTCVWLSYRRRSRERELGAEMIREMLSRKMTAEEIERVLLAWTGRRQPLHKYMTNPVPAAAAYMPEGKPLGLGA